MGVCQSGTSRVGVCQSGGCLPMECLRDRIDAIIPHEYEELRIGSHARALEAAAKTKLPITKEARRLCRARAR